MTLHHDEENEVKINCLLDEEVASFNSRVKCFPLYTLMLAVNHTDVDVLSLGVQGQELQVGDTFNLQQNIKMEFKLFLRSPMTKF